MTAAVASTVFAPLLRVVSLIFFPPESLCDLFLPHLCEESIASFFGFEIVLFLHTLNGARIRGNSVVLSCCGVNQISKVST
jgi:hypothetical protein